MTKAETIGLAIRVSNTFGETPIGDLIDLLMAIGDRELLARLELAINETERAACEWIAEELRH